jgi:hypothetical protein
LADPQAVDDRPEDPELFISYASGDLDRAAILHARLTAEGFHVWFDKLRLTPGCDWHREIEAGCEAARVILPLITPNWAKSEWTRYETYAHDAVIPVLAEGKAEAVMPPPLRRWNAVALDPLAADEAGWQPLLAAIRAKLAEPAPEGAPRIVNLPYPANPFFTGRDDDLVRIHEELHTAPVAALTQGRVRALAAMGGIGKTTLANEYARRYWRLYPQILWVDARAGLESGFALMFDMLFPGRSDTGLQQPDKAKLVLAELSGRGERLLVLDNVEDAESVRPWLPRDPTGGCRTLITPASPTGQRRRASVRSSCMCWNRNRHGNSCWHAPDGSRRAPNGPPVTIWPGSWATCRWHWSRPGPTSPLLAQGWISPATCGSTERRQQSCWRAGPWDRPSIRTR